VSSGTGSKFNRDRDIPLFMLGVRNSTENRDSRLGRNFRSPLALRFYVSEAIATSRAFCPQPYRTH
jgi:hypothetical protein